MSSHPRRAFLISAALAGCACAARIGVSSAANAPIAFEFRGRVPEAVTFRRPSAASLIPQSGPLANVGSEEPRLTASGLLIEGAMANLVGNSAVVAAAGAAVEWLPRAIAPDGSPGCHRIVRNAQAGSRADVMVAGAIGEGFGTASVWLRSTRAGLWRIGLKDMVSADGTARSVNVTPAWQRFSVTELWQYRATGAKRFAVLEAAGPGEDLLPDIEVWGPQYELTSYASTPAAARAADAVTFDARVLAVPRGRLKLVLPDGGRRGAVVLDANGAGNGIRLEYSPSGWIGGRIGGVAFSSLIEVADDPVVELQWSAAGVQIATGRDPDRLVARDAVAQRPKPLDCGPTARLGMTLEGERPIGRSVASVALDDRAGALVPVRRPLFVPSRYSLVFGDEFDDPDVRRINENAVGGRKGAPAWRSRYHHDRKTVINQEKQIYVDAGFAGTAAAPLGVQPFSIAEGVLRIRADRADPLRVSPHIWNHRYVSGCITSENTHRQKYGYFEIRARLPLGKGLWPGFWMLPASNAWPPEIDALECSGTRPMSVRQGKIEKARQPGTVNSAWVDGIIAISDAFHCYGVEWTDKAITFFLDGRQTLQFENRTIHEEMYLLANLALGSHDQNWIPDPDGSTKLPAFYEIDYIRAYARG